MKTRFQFRTIALLALAWSLVLQLSVSCSPEKLKEGDPVGDVSILAAVSGHQWKVGDAVFVTLSGGGSARLEVVSVRATGSAVLRGTFPEGKTLEGVAVFPYGDYAKTSSGYLLNLPESYDDGADDRAFLVANVEHGSRQLSFSPVGGKISVSFDQIPSIARGVVFTSDTPVCGEYTLTDNGSGKYSLIPTEKSVRSVHITFDSQKESGTFVFPLPVGNYANWAVAMEDARGERLRFALPQSALDLRISKGSSIVKDKITFPRFNSTLTERVYGLAENAVVSMYEDDKDTVLAEGIRMADIHFVKRKAKEYGTDVRAYIIEADLSNPKNHLRIGAPSANTAYFNARDAKTLTKQAETYASLSTETRPMVVINGDFWCMAESKAEYRYKLRGPIHYRGEIIKSSFLYEEQWSEQALSYVGVLKDGSLTIREKSDYSSRQSSLEECSGAGIVFLQDGVIPDLIANDSEDPRTAIGYHDKTLVILVADGRQSNWSAGLNYTEMGYIMKAMGCTWAANLDGGKSSELVVWNLESGKYKVHNRICSDNHSERNIAESWMIFTDATTN